MQLTEVTTATRTAAREAFLEYKRAVEESYEKEARAASIRWAEVIVRQREADETIMAGYRQLALGRQVVDLRATLAAGGLDNAGRPKIALARADQERVAVLVESDGGVTFDNPTMRLRSRSAARITLPPHTFPRANRSVWGSWPQSVVPSIPPHFRPTTKLDKFWLAFEAKWDRVPIDPALLRPIGSGLAVVVATWDLTPLEAAVLAMTR